MRRVLLIAFVVFGVGVAHAQDFSVGVRTGLANYAGLEFGVPLESFTIRAVVDGAPFETLWVSWLFSLEGLYRIPTDANGSNFYIGIGVGAWLTTFGIAAPTCPTCGPPSPGLFPQVHALLGFEWRLGDGFGLALESSPLMLHLRNDPPRVAFLPINLINVRLIYHF